MRSIKLFSVVSVVAYLASCGGQPQQAAEVAEYCIGQRNLALVNGSIYTMDENNRVVDSVFIKNGYFAHLGGSDYAGQDCTDQIDLQGATVIPGLIDNHAHVIRIQNMPGYDTRELESTFTLAEVLDALSTKAASVPAGEIITTIGGIRRWQWQENRFPTIEELDQRLPNHPVYISESGFGPGQVNSAARQMLIDGGMEIGEDGVVPQGVPTDQAFHVLSANVDDTDRRRQLQELITWLNSVGMTGALDMTGTVPGVGYLDQTIGYDPIRSLDRTGELNLRTRIYFAGIDEDGDLDYLKNRLDNSFRDFGSDMLKVSGIGEWSVGRNLFNERPLGAAAVEAQRRIAERGWSYHQHLHTPEEISAHLDVWEALDAEFDLSELRWTPGHMSGVTPELVQRIVALGLGIGVHGQPYLQAGNAGPPWRTIVNSGAVATGGGSDGARIAPLNPWTIIYYMVTGKNAAGTLVNADQTITRTQAVRLYSSAEQGWFTKEDDTLGGIDVGRYADLVVLSADVFDEEAVSDEDIRKMTSALTLVGGKVVYSDGSLVDAM